MSHPSPSAPSLVRLYVAAIAATLLITTIALPFLWIVLNLTVEAVLSWFVAPAAAGPWPSVVTAVMTTPPMALLFVWIFRRALAAEREIAEGRAQRRD